MTQPRPLPTKYSESAIVVSKVPSDALYPAQVTFDSVSDMDTFENNAATDDAVIRRVAEMQHQDNLIRDRKHWQREAEKRGIAKAEGRLSLKVRIVKYVRKIFQPEPEWAPFVPPRQARIEIIEDALHRLQQSLNKAPRDEKDDISAAMQRLASQRQRLLKP